MIAVTRALTDYAPSQSNSPDQFSLDELHNIALQGAGMSRFFWPSKTTYARRGDCLRKAFGITDESPLSSRELRNLMEHFDERLDDYLKGEVAGSVVTNYFGPKPPLGQSPSHVLRAFFTDTEEFVIFGKVFAFKPLVDEIDRIHHLLAKCVTQGWRFPPSDR